MDGEKDLDIEDFDLDDLELDKNSTSTALLAEDGQGIRKKPSGLSRFFFCYFLRTKSE